MASQITSVSIVCSVCSGAVQRKHQSSVSLAFMRGIQRWPVDSPHKDPVTRKIFPFDDVIMNFFPSYHKTYPILYAWGYAFCEFKVGSMLYGCRCCYIYIQYHKGAGSVMRQAGVYWVNSMLNSMLVNKDFLTLPLIGWQLCCQPIRCQVWKSLLTNMEFSMEILTV